MASNANTAVSLVNLKETALYFDHVIPLNLSMEVIWEVSKKKDFTASPKSLEAIFEEQDYAGVIGTLVPKSLSTSSDFHASIGKMNVIFFDLMRKAICERYNLPPNYDGMSEKEYETIERTTFVALEKFLKKFHLKGSAIDLPELYVDDGANATDISATLASLQLINARKSSWKQIIELRKDSIAREKLRRLRLFAYENYVGKEKAFIEDDILNRVSEYERVSKEWGFETTQGALTMILNSKFLAGALTGSFISSLFGAPIPALMSITGGAAIEFGRTALFLKKRKFLLSKAMDENYVSYVSYAQSRLGEASKGNVAIDFR